MRADKFLDFQLNAPLFAPLSAATSIVPTPLSIALHIYSLISVVWL
jgi:hypothetical protein